MHWFTVYGKETSCIGTRQDFVLLLDKEI